MRYAALAQAQREIDEERFRAEVEKQKEVLRKRSDFWNRVFPWRIRFVRRYYPEHEKKIATSHLLVAWFCSLFGEVIFVKNGELECRDD